MENMCFFSFLFCCPIVGSFRVQLRASRVLEGFWKGPGFQNSHSLASWWRLSEDSLQVEMVCAFNTIPRDVARNTSWFVTWPINFDFLGEGLCGKWSARPAWMIHLSSMRLQGVEQMDDPCLPPNGHMTVKGFFPVPGYVNMCQHVVSQPPLLDLPLKKVRV